MFSTFAMMFGSLLNIIYNFVHNYGIAIILFTIIIKLAMLPITINQQKSMKKNAKVQEKMKVLQVKYKGDKEKLNQEVMAMYKEEKMNPMSGCLSAIIQMVLMISIFYMIRNPLTYMQNMDSEKIDHYIQQLEYNDKYVSTAYRETDIIRESAFLIKENPDDPDVERTNLNMNFLGLDLNRVPNQNLTDWTVYIIPVIYIISTFISIRITTMYQTKKKEKNKLLVEDNNKNAEKPAEPTSMEQMNKTMMWMMPIMSISISMIAPLGLALYWLTNNILMICERLVLNKVLKDEDKNEVEVI